MRRPPRPSDVIRHLRSRLPFGSTVDARDSPLPFVPRQPAVQPILPVVDMADAIEFYRQLGFAVTSYDADYAWVQHCGWELFHLRHIGDLDPSTNVTAAYLHVGDVDAWHGAMAGAAGGGVVGVPETMPWGLREFSFSDPSGNTIRVGQFV
jgi:predicted enzyme related to lactoylglutathione lyase